VHAQLLRINTSQSRRCCDTHRRPRDHMSASRRLPLTRNPPPAPPGAQDRRRRVVCVYYILFLGGDDLFTSSGARHCGTLYRCAINAQGTVAAAALVRAQSPRRFVVILKRQTIYPIETGGGYRRSVDYTISPSYTMS